jgi:2-hydroxycyclohexanecarboxyl-CoA dehydrogenase
MSESHITSERLRAANTEDGIATAVTFLACEDAGYITGQTLSVSGGLTMA